MIKHALFPVLVGQFNYEKANEFKETLFTHGLKHFNESGFSNERTGHVCIHHEPEFSELYGFLTTCVKEYLQSLNVDPELFEINVVKSWFNVIRHQQTPLHAHGDAHISLVYYANTPESCQQLLRFHNYHFRMEPFPGSIRYNNTSDNWNEFNSYTWAFMPNEGDVFVFPSQMMHETVGNVDHDDSGVKTQEDFKSHRCSIAADIVLTYKDSQAKPLGIQPVQNWKTFNG